jgi:hypothetical protein
MFRSCFLIPSLLLAYDWVPLPRQQRSIDVAYISIYISLSCIKYTIVCGPKPGRSESPEIPRSPPARTRARPRDPPESRSRPNPRTSWNLENLKFDTGRASTQPLTRNRDSALGKLSSIENGFPDELVHIFVQLPRSESIDSRACGVAVWLVFLPPPYLTNAHTVNVYSLRCPS